MLASVPYLPCVDGDRDGQLPLLAMLYRYQDRAHPLPVDDPASDLRGAGLHDADDDNRPGP